MPLSPWARVVAERNRVAQFRLTQRKRDHAFAEHFGQEAAERWRAMPFRRSLHTWRKSDVEGLVIAAMAAWHYGRLATGEIARVEGYY